MRLHVAQTAVVYVLPRQIAVYIARQLTSASLKEIGKEFGHRVR
jgi:chromosomal replication initiation ATPase DnaA